MFSLIASGPSNIAWAIRVYFHLYKFYLDKNECKKFQVEHPC